MKNNKQPPLYLLLASMSRYRAECLKKLQSPFEQWAPHVDETPFKNEHPQDLVVRLAIKKAQAGLAALESMPGYIHFSHIIASDQAMVLDGQILGKPHTVENAKTQLTAMSGQSITFLTSLCVTDIATQQQQTGIDATHVHFRQLSETQIENYIAMEKPLDCAGSFKSEGAGIVLCHGIEGKDPNALVGLPLILLTDMLAELGYKLP